MNVRSETAKNVIDFIYSCRREEYLPNETKIRQILANILPNNDQPRTEEPSLFDIFRRRGTATGSSIRTFAPKFRNEATIASARPRALFSSGVA